MNKWSNKLYSHTHTYTHKTDIQNNNLWITTMLSNPCGYRTHNTQNSELFKPSIFGFIKYKFTLKLVWLNWSVPAVRQRLALPSVRDLVVRVLFMNRHVDFLLHLNVLHDWHGHVLDHRHFFDHWHLLDYRDMYRDMHFRYMVMVDCMHLVWYMNGHVLAVNKKVQLSKNNIKSKLMTCK